MGRSKRIGKVEGKADAKILIFSSSPSRNGLEAALEISRNVLKSCKAAGHLACFPFMAVGCLLFPIWGQLHQSECRQDMRVKQREGGCSSMWY